MNVNVLVVEDNPDDALIVRRLLGREQGRYDVMVADNFTGARALLADVQFEVVLLDLGLPDVHENFIQTLVGEHPDTPFIVLTGDDNDKTAENALAQGAQDYLYKGRLDRALLVRSIGYAISHKRAESRLKTTLQELKDTQVELVQRERLSALGQMASGIAHDFNNAIAPILSQADYLLTFDEVRQDDCELRKSLAAIQQAAIDAGLVVGRLKTFYSPPNADIEIVPLDLALLARDTVNLTKPLWRDEALAEGKEIATTITSEGNTWVRANAIEIKEALTNLIFNAVAAIPVRGAIEITVSGDEQSVSLSVSDDGEGMDSETLNRCFEPFYSTRGDVGTGLGLSLVKTTMEKNGSDVQLTSFPGVGTTFQFEFAATEPIARNLVPMPEPKADTAEEAKRRIVIVEDELPIRRIIKMSLIQLGHEVTDAANGREALEMIDRDHCDLIVTDCAMPVMNGYELCAELLERDISTPVVMLTGYGDSTQSGANLPNIKVVLGKPCTMSELRHAIGLVDNAGDTAALAGRL